MKIPESKEKKIVSIDFGREKIILSNGKEKDLWKLEGAESRVFNWSTGDAEKFLRYTDELPIMSVKNKEGDFVTLKFIKKGVPEKEVDKIVFTAKKKCLDRRKPATIKMGMTFEEAKRFAEAFKIASKLREVKTEL